MLTRRGFIFGAGATLAVIRTPGLIMPVRPFSVEDVAIGEVFPDPAGPYNFLMAIQDHICNIEFYETPPWNKLQTVRVVDTLPDSIRKRPATD